MKNLLRKIDYKWKILILSLIASVILFILAISPKILIFIVYVTACIQLCSWWHRFVDYFMEAYDEWN